jgi:transposase-like protein
MKTTTNRTLTDTEKAEAIRLHEEGHMPAAAIARRLGVPPVLIYQLQKQHTKNEPLALIEAELKEIERRHERDHERRRVALEKAKKLAAIPQYQERMTQLIKQLEAMQPTGEVAEQKRKAA